MPGFFTSRVWPIFCNRQSAIHGIKISTHARIFLLTSLAMIAFAGNSLLCRLALKATGIDAASFTTIRLVSGALMLCLLAYCGKSRPAGKGNWFSAFALFAYAAGFSFAYLDLSAAMGALLLFGAVQVTMISHGIVHGERMQGLSLFGFLLALSGLVGLLLPGLTAPPLIGSVLMSCAGIAWGIYSLRGRAEGDALRITAGNFSRAAVIAIVFSVFFLKQKSLAPDGVIYAVCSGAITSGIGYAVWYRVLPALKATTAAVVQLGVPALAALGGVVLLDEHVSLRLLVASIAILGGIAMVLMQGRKNPQMLNR